MNSKIAAIDIGTNSFHLLIAYLDNEGKIKIIDSARKVIRLNSISKSKNIIEKEAIDKSFIILKDFKRIAQHQNAKIKVVATSAVREAENKLEFIDQVYNSVGIEIEVIDGKTEAELIYKGIQQAIDIVDKTTLCIDIGGGSTEFIVGKKGRIEFVQSVKLGAVQLTKMFFKNSFLTDTQINKCENYIRQELLDVVEIISKYKIDLVVGSSGTINSVALIKNANNDKQISRNKLNGYKYSKNDLEQIKTKILNAKTIEERKQLKGLEEKRADVIPAGIILLSIIFEILNIQNLTISSYALREGIVVENITPAK